MTLARSGTRPVVVQALSVGVASGAYGVSFGALAVTAGFTAPQTVALSVLMFTGGSQFALVGVVGAGGGGLAATASAGLLGVRNGFYAVQVAPLLGVSGARRLAAAHLTIDESTAVGTAQADPRLVRLGFWAAGTSVLVLWTAATVAGTALGDVMGDPRRWGLDAAAASAFLALLWPRLRGGDAVAVAVVAALVALLAVPVVPAGLPVLLAVVSVPLVLLVGRLRAGTTCATAPPSAPGRAASGDRDDRDGDGAP